jgi:3-deoxy-7-phosphoheptulonate synthase
MVPINPEIIEQVLSHRGEISRIISREDLRWLLIVGPCSAWSAEAVLEYAKKLARLANDVRDALRIVMRVYIQKPRTKRGWRGPLSQPDPFSPPDIELGMIYCRKMMLEVLRLGLPVADEALHTHNVGGFGDLLAWMAIGARSTESTDHRDLASWVDWPVGMKNPTSGSIEIGVNSVVAAQHGHTFVFNGRQIVSSGNPYAHLVLRGGYKTGQNYHPKCLYEAAELMKKERIKHPAILIDASHDNASVDGNKHHRQQIHVVGELLDYLGDTAYSDLLPTFVGFMVESYLKPGAQKLEGRKRDEVDMGGLSVTDPCIGWEETDDLIHRVAETWQKIHKA